LFATISPELNQRVRSPVLPGKWGFLHHEAQVFNCSIETMAYLYIGRLSLLICSTALAGYLFLSHPGQIPIAEKKPQQALAVIVKEETGINPLQRLFIEYNPPGCFQCEGWSRVGLGKRSSLIQRFPAF
jgi:hypothetical protein